MTNIYCENQDNMPMSELKYKIAKPDPSIYDYVESFWMIDNCSDIGKDIIVLPDGRIDLFFTYSSNEPFHVVILGLSTEPTKVIFPPHRIIFAISFKLLAIEYILDTPIVTIINQAKLLPDNFWGFSQDDMNNFDVFCVNANKKISELLKVNIDKRKQLLFNLIYFSNGSMTVKELSEKSFWNSRQINRYFNQQFGLTLKSYCNILRFRASFQHIKEGKLFPEQNFADQAHFIKEIKKLAGVVPKELSKNKNDRFIQLLTLPLK